MKHGNSAYRIPILIGIVVLIAVFSGMAINLFSQLRALSSAQQDNPQWSISQLETEFANLEATLSQKVANPELPEDQVRLRVDIMLSRLKIINSGQSADLLAAHKTTSGFDSPVASYVENMIEIVDRSGSLSDADIDELLALTKGIRPVIRQTVMRGVNVAAQRTQMQRDQFSAQLALTGGIAIVLLVMMAALMLFLDRLLRRAAENDAKLSASSQRLSSTISASLDAIVTADAGGKIVEFNEAAEQIFGWRRNDIIGRAFDETLIPPSLRNRDMSLMERFLATGNQSIINGGRVEMIALRKSGEQFPVELNIQAIHDNGETAFVAYLRDISERKIAEQSLIDARDRAERTDKAKSHFLTVMSHEMRTPLNGILGVIDLMKSTRLTKTQTRYTQIAMASGEILLEHINEALDITRIETGTLELNNQDFELGPMVTNLITILEPLVSEKGLTLAQDVDPALSIGYRGDSARIRQILTNLIGNAIKFTKTGQIKVDVSGIHGAEVSSLRFSILDTGPGIAPEHCEQIFEDFDALAHGQPRQSRGEGVSLSISRKLARQMGGDLSVTSVLGEGSCFNFTVQLQRQEHASTEQTRGAAANRDVEPSGCDILMVEDNAINRKVLGDMLKRLGHRTSEALNGIEGVERASLKKFDAIFMDISMPKMDGIEATKHIRTGGGPNAHTHIIGLTAHSRDEFMTSAIAAGMSDFHMKPIRLKALADILKGCTETSVPRSRPLNSA